MKSQYFGDMVLTGQWCQFCQFIIIFKHIFTYIYHKCMITRFEESLKKKILLNISDSICPKNPVSVRILKDRIGFFLFLLSVSVYMRSLHCTEGFMTSRQSGETLKLETLSFCSSYIDAVNPVSYTWVLFLKFWPTALLIFITFVLSINF